MRLSRVLRKCNSIQATKIQSKLNVEHPATVKVMVKSNVSGGFFLRLPPPFCRAHLPVKNRTVMVLETDTGERYEANYLPQYCGLSGGWKRFAIVMKLEEGDTVVFQLVEPAKFKVYFIRVNSTNEVHLPFHLLNLVNRVESGVSRKAGKNQKSFYRSEEVHQNYLQGKQKDFGTEKIRRKDLLVPQVLGKSNLVHAKNIQSELDFKHPLTLQGLKKWNVSHGCSLILPEQYCSVHLPVIETDMVLEIETGEQYTTKYLPRSCKLSDGWHMFATNMRLEEGDVIVFHLVEAAKFKVYFIRVNSANEVNLSPHILNTFQKCDMTQSKRSLSNLIVEHPDIPVTVKWLPKSCTSSSCFILSPPTPFCRAHLPQKDTTLVFQTETGEQYEANYLARYLRFGGGCWKRFPLDKELEAGDAVVFHLVEVTKFKVYIIRANASEVNLPVHLLELLGHVQQSVSGKPDSKQQTVDRREVNQREHNRRKSARLNPRNTEVSTVLLHEKMIFSNINSFEEFKSVMNELIQNQKLPYYAMHGYYELCCNQKEFLHARLSVLINPRLTNQVIIGVIRRIIFDIVNITDALTTCELSTFLHNYALWDESLKTYETLGMNVGFLLARLHHLEKVAVSSESAADRCRYEEACHENLRAKSEVRKLDLILAKLQTLKLKPRDETYRKAEISELEVMISGFGKFFLQYDAHIETLKLKVKTHELKFQEEVSSSWL
ncbi:uncharacterized protein [Spinacia oleracea]|nr:uncharacterized protein LOC110801772 isoform X2 [Spinacia oleracea]